jgi:predicted aspartyl protease
VQVTALIDTGSTHTLVNTEVYYRLPRLSLLCTSNIPRLSSITHHVLPVKGTCTVSLAGRTVDVTVCDQLGIDVLIGADLCQHAVIDFVNKTFVLGHREFPTFPLGIPVPSRLCRLYLAPLIRLSMM